MDERISRKLEAMKSAEQALVHRKTEKIRCVEAQVDIAIDILQQVKKQQISEIEDHFDRQMSRSKLQEEDSLLKLYIPERQFWTIIKKGPRLY